MAIVHIGVGSNMGDRQNNCARAVEELRNKGITVRKISSMRETEPWGLREQPKFINMALEAETSMSPYELLSALKSIEEDMGRKEAVKWGPRIIDLDILFYDDIVIENTELKIPHQHLHKRAFVLKPMVEIATDKKHPLMNKTVKELLEDINNA